MKGKSLIPYFGDKSTREELDRLFSREVLGSILLGSAIGKVVEKTNIILMVVLIIWINGIQVTKEMWYTAAVLLIIWSMESLIFILLYLKWDEYMQQVSEKSNKAKEKVGEAKEKVTKTEDEVDEFV
jgi:hypothetical protein